MTHFMAQARVGSSAWKMCASAHGIPMTMLCFLMPFWMPIGASFNRFDDLLGGGAREGCVLEVAGESASGKTQLCLGMAAVTACRGEPVIYIDTTNSFSALRLEQLMHAHGCTDVPAALQLVQVYKAHSMHVLMAVLDAISVQMQSIMKATPGGVGQETPAAVQSNQQQASNLTQQPAAAQADAQAAPHKPTVLILDSISAVGGSVIGERRHSQGQTLVMSAGRMLRQLADMYSLAVVVTNHLVHDRSAERGGQEQGRGGQGQAGMQPMVPAMGEWWRGQVHMRLQLRLQPIGSLEAPRIATLTQHPNKVGLASSTACCAWCVEHLPVVDVVSTAMDVHK